MVTVLCKRWSGTGTTGTTTMTTAVQYRPRQKQPCRFCSRRNVSEVALLLLETSPEGLRREFEPNRGTLRASVNRKLLFLPTCGYRQTHNRAPPQHHLLPAYEPACTVSTFRVCLRLLPEGLAFALLPDSAPVAVLSSVEHDPAAAPAEGGKTRISYYHTAVLTLLKLDRDPRWRRLGATKAAR